MLKKMLFRPLKQLSMRYAACIFTLNIVLSIFFSVSVNAQDTVSGLLSSVQFSGLLDVYFSTSLRSTTERQRPFGGANFTRTEQVSINLALLQARWQQGGARIQVGLMWGDYPAFNLASEPPLLQGIHEAYTGIALNNKSSLWLDAGIFASHIGYESLISQKNVCLTRSFASETTPYYNAGARLLYTPEGKWRVGLHAMNGWQRFLRSNQKEGLYAGGHSLSWHGKILEVHTNSYVGASPRNQRILRLFLNTFVHFHLSEEAGVYVGVDAGGDQQSIGSNKWNSWQTYGTIFYFQYHKKLRQAFRAEYLTDPNILTQYLLMPATDGATKVSASVDFLGVQQAILRGEVKYLHLSDPAFLSKDKRYSYDLQITFSLVGYF